MASHLLNKFLFHNSVIINYIPRVSKSLKNEAIQSHLQYFVAYQKDLEELQEKVRIMEKEISDLKTKVETGCGCYCSKQ